MRDPDEAETPLDSEEHPDRPGTDQAHARDTDGHDYVDRSKIDFDPDDGLYTGTAIDGTSDIPGPHEHEGSGHDQAGSEQDRQPGQDS